MKLDIVIKKVHQKLKRNNIKSALLDSEILLSKAINKSREFIILNQNHDVSEKEYVYLREMINQRTKGKPLAYITGKKFFWKYNFINRYIPRPDTEVIVEQVLKIYKNKHKINFLDIGFGSGCILLSILKEKKYFLATGVDICNYASKVCKINAYKLGVSNRVRLFKSDIDKFSTGKYDLIISNPPYINNLELKYLDKDIISYEPLVSLNGGLDGSFVLNKVIKKSSSLLKIGGKLVLEIGFDQKYKVMSLLKKKRFFINKVVKDYANKDRCIIATKI